MPKKVPKEESTRAISCIASPKATQPVPWAAVALDQRPGDPGSGQVANQMMPRLGPLPRLGRARPQVLLGEGAHAVADRALLRRQQLVRAVEVEVGRTIALGHGGSILFSRVS